MDENKNTNDNTRAAGTTPTILFEDNHIMIVVKPQMIPVQEDSSGDADFLSILKDYIKVRDEKPGNVFLGLVHRLDRPTGGVMVFAKTSKAAARLSEQIRDGKISKKYLAITVGIPKNKRGYLTDYLLKDEKNNIVIRCAAAEKGSKKAELEYTVLSSTAQFTDTDNTEEQAISHKSDGRALVEIGLITGRSHQIRVQLAGIGTPILGDGKYAGDKFIKGNLALWSHSLTLMHPITQSQMTFRAAPPKDKTWGMFDVEKYIAISKP